MNELAPLSDKVLAKARTCPRCDAPATPARAVQTCVHCKKPFVLIAAARLDESVLSKGAGTQPVKLKYAEAVLRHAAIVDDVAVSLAELDPVTGHIPMGTRSIPFGDIVTIGLYRRVAWGTLAVLVLLYLLPVVLPLLAWSTQLPMLLLLALPALALFVLGLKKTIGIGVQRMRLVGTEDAITLRFDTPMWKRKRFLTAVCERSGVGPLPWP